MKIYSVVMGEMFTEL